MALLVFPLQVFEQLKFRGDSLYGGEHLHLQHKRLQDRCNRSHSLQHDADPDSMIELHLTQLDENMLSEPYLIEM